MNPDNRHVYCQQKMFNEIEYQGKTYGCEGTPDRVLIGKTIFAVTWNKEFLPYKAETIIPATDGFDRAIATVSMHTEDPLPRMLISLRRLYKAAGRVESVSLQDKNKCSITLTLSRRPQTKSDDKAFRYNAETGVGESPYQDITVVINHENVINKTVILLIPDDFSRNPRGMTMEDIEAYHTGVASRIAHGFMHI